MNNGNSKINLFVCSKPEFKKSFDIYIYIYIHTQQMHQRLFYSIANHFCFAGPQRADGTSKAARAVRCACSWDPSRRCSARVRWETIALNVLLSLLGSPPDAAQQRRSQRGAQSCDTLRTPTPQSCYEVVRLRAAIRAAASRVRNSARACHLACSKAASCGLRSRPPPHFSTRPHR